MVSSHPQCTTTGDMPGPVQSSRKSATARGTGRNLAQLIFGCGLALLLTACGDGSQEPATPADSSSTGAEPPAGICGLLSHQQVETVVPGSDAGTPYTNPMAAMLHDVQAQGCRYVHVEGTDAQYLLVTIYRAATEQGFEDIDISYMQHKGSLRQLDIGDMGFLEPISDNWTKISVGKGRTVLLLELNAGDAAEKTGQLVALARVLAEKL